MNIGITGASGQLGQELQQLASQFPQWTFHFADRTIADLSQPETLDRWLSKTQPDCLINCAAYTNVNQAETEAELARLINVQGVAHLATYCKQAVIPFVHYSTDYVYHLDRSIPYRENDPCDPKGVYAKTKLEGEQRALAIYPLSTIIRTSWVYSSYGHNFVKTMLRLGQERAELKVVFDQIGTPTYAKDLAQASLQILTQWQEGLITPTELGGIFNFSNEGVCSWYDFALAIFDLSGISCQVLPVESHEFPSPVARPHFSVLNKTKIKSTFGLVIPHWRVALERCLGELR
jgi:dTDP-4-dehydrorhamnose reductase